MSTLRDFWALCAIIRQLVMRVFLIRTVLLIAFSWSNAEKWHLFADVCLTDTRRDVENVISITDVLNNTN